MLCPIRSGPARIRGPKQGQHRHPQKVHHRREPVDLGGRQELRLVDEHAVGGCGRYRLKQVGRRIEGCGIGGEPEDVSYGGLNRDSVVRRNVITDCSDDGIQVEGGVQNVLVSGNTVKRCLIGIAFAPALTGPADLELTVDVYFPRTVLSLPSELSGRTAHPGGRNRLMLDGHAKFFRDARTPSG